MASCGFLVSNHAKGRPRYNRRPRLPRQAQPIILVPEKAGNPILYTLPEGKADPRAWTIQCLIWDLHVDHALFDLEASVNIMPKVMFDEWNYPTLSPTQRE